MNGLLNETHASDLASWVESANRPDCPFPIQNLPFGVFRRREGHESRRVGVAIGDEVLDVSAALELGLIGDAARKAAQSCASSSLNALMSLGSEHWSALRRHLSRLLRQGNHQASSLSERLLVAQQDAEMLLPAQIGDYTDFYASIDHATNVGSMFRPDNPLLPNYKHIPIGYHGRSSTIVPSQTPLLRPMGQTKADDADQPVFGPCKLLDYELEVGFFVGPGNRMGQRIPIERAADHIFGLCLVNDWSARDVQKWEYQPLGPFLGKSFATSVSPWVVTLEALAPYRTAAYERPQGDPRPLPYLLDEEDQARGGVGLTVEAWLSSEKMRSQQLAPQRLSRGDFRNMYWTLAQMLTHHSSNGCALRPGDLMASGTVSGPEAEARGCLLELTWRGRDPIELPSGETRRFLADGDELTITGYCEREGFARIGLGECRGQILPAL